MLLLLRVNGQSMRMDMEQAVDKVLSIGSYQYRPAHIARKTRKLATQMWGDQIAPVILDQRFYFEAFDNYRATSSWGDSGNFTPANGASVALGHWDEDATVGIALHELAHEMHLRNGGYDHSSDVIREALALMAEREAGLSRRFDREPYYTASNLVAELSELRHFRRMSFKQRWDELVVLMTDTELSDVVNYYLDRSEGLGFDRWLRRYTDRPAVREALLSVMANCSLRYSLDYRRALVRGVARCHLLTPFEQLVKAFDALMTLDSRYPDDDLERMINFCFAPLARSRRGPLAFG